MPDVQIVITMTQSQHDSMMNWLGRIGEAHVDEEAEHPGHELVVSVHPLENTASVVCGGAELQLGEIGFSKKSKTA